MIKEFGSDEEYHSWCDEDPEYRLILNTNRNGYAKRDTCIHLASCRSIRATSKPGGFTKGGYEKVGSLTVKELEDWLNEKRRQKGLAEIEVKQHSCVRKRLASPKRLHMNSKLKELYRKLIEERKGEIGDWHDQYQNFHNEVGEVRNKLQSGYKLHYEKDEDFLESLLYEKANGIADVGRSSWSKKDYR